MQEELVITKIEQPTTTLPPPLLIEPYDPVDSEGESYRQWRWYDRQAHLPASQQAPMPAVLREQRQLVPAQYLYSLPRPAGRGRGQARPVRIAPRPAAPAMAQQENEPPAVTPATAVPPGQLVVAPALLVRVPRGFI